MILIAAAGKSSRWKNHLGLKKHMVPIGGVPLIHRTIQQINLFLCRFSSGDKIGVICYDPAFVIPPAIQLIPNKPSPLPFTGLGQSVEFWPENETLYLFLGDVVFTENAINQIFMQNRNEHAVTFFGHSKPVFLDHAELFGHGLAHHPELFAFSVPPECQPELLEAMKKADEWRTELMQDKAKIYMSGGWFTYRLLNHLPVFMHQIGENFIELDPEVTDIDSKEDYDRVCKLYARNT